MTKQEILEQVKSERSKLINLMTISSNTISELQEKLSDEDTVEYWEIHNVIDNITKASLSI